MGIEILRSFVRWNGIPLGTRQTRLEIDIQSDYEFGEMEKDGIRKEEVTADRLRFSRRRSLLFAEN